MTDTNHIAVLFPDSVALSETRSSMVRKSYPQLNNQNCCVHHQRHLEARFSKVPKTVLLCKANF